MATQLRFDQCPCTIVVELPIKDDYFYYRNSRCVALRLQCVECGFIHVKSLPDTYEETAVPYRVYRLQNGSYVRLASKQVENTGGTQCQAHGHWILRANHPTV